MGKKTKKKIKKKRPYRKKRKKKSSLLKKITTFLFLSSLFFCAVIFAAFLWSYSNVKKKWEPLIEQIITQQQQRATISVYGTDSQQTKKWIGSFSQGRLEERTYYPLSEINPLLTQSILSIEDPRFLSHSGFDKKGILRAAIKNIQKMRFAQGGSTITQQLVKNLFLTHEKSLKRKYNELIISTLIESKYSKDAILESYLNEVYLGNYGHVQIHGVGRASQYYFNKSASNLETHESALLAAIINSPRRFNPWKYPKRALERRNKVLKALKKNNFILEDELNSSLKEKLPEQSKYNSPTQSTYLLNAIRKQLISDKDSESLFKSFEFPIDLDIELQKISEDILKKTQKKFGPSSQALIVAASPENCSFQTYVGGSHYNKTQLDRITQSKRSIGSLFKPLALYSLFKDFPEKELYDQINDQKFTWYYNRGNSQWSPQNYDKKFKGLVSIRDIITRSLNVSFIKLFFNHYNQRSFKEMLFPTFDTFSLNLKERSYLPSQLIGVHEQRPVDLLFAYTKLARLALGLNNDNCSKIFFEKKDSLPSGNGKDIQALKVISTLQSALQNGTSVSLGRNISPKSPWGGKTGTSSNYKDSWYVAVHPKIILLAWLGRDDNQPTEHSGASGALQIIKPLVLHLEEKWLKEDPSYFDSIHWFPQSQHLDTLSWLLIDPINKCQYEFDESFQSSNYFKNISYGDSKIKLYQELSSTVPTNCN